MAVEAWGLVLSPPSWSAAWLKVPGLELLCRGLGMVLRLWWSWELLCRGLGMVLLSLWWWSWERLWRGQELGMGITLPL